MHDNQIIGTEIFLLLGLIVTSKVWYGLGRIAYRKWMKRSEVAWDEN